MTEPQTKTASALHAATPYTITLEKTKGGFYRVRARIDHAEFVQHLDWQDGSGHVWVDHGTHAHTMRPGETLDANPYQQAVAQIEGMIDAVQDMLAARDRLRSYMSQLPDDLVSRAVEMADNDQLLPLHNLFNHPEAAPDARATVRYDQLKEESKMAIKPKTEATPENIKAMRAETTRLIDKFGGPSGVSFVCTEHYRGTEHADKFRRGTVGQWNNRGRISADAANLMAAVPEIQAAGFTRESLRPDVTFWYVD